MNNVSTRTAAGLVPHFVHKGHAYPVRVRVDTSAPNKLPAVDVDVAGFAYYALPGGGKATRTAITARRNDNV